jgi:hypothetical protein
VGNRKRFSIGGFTPQILVAPIDKINRVEFGFEQPTSRDIIEAENQAVIAVQERDDSRIKLGAVRRVLQQHRILEPSQYNLVPLGVTAVWRSEVDALDEKFEPVNCRPVRGKIIKFISMMFPVNYRPVRGNIINFLSVIFVLLRGNIIKFISMMFPVNYRPVRGNIINFLSVIFVSLRG